jgi:hypothetical protein
MPGTGFLTNYALQHTCHNKTNNNAFYYQTLTTTQQLLSDTQPSPFFALLRKMGLVAANKRNIARKHTIITLYIKSLAANAPQLTIRTYAKNNSLGE